MSAAEAAPAPLVVVGDSLVDRDLDGSATRLAPDAPAPVVDVLKDRVRPGGAALAACLAARAVPADRPVLLVTALGTDQGSDTVRETLATAGVRLAELPLRDGGLPVKTRVMAGGRPLVRYDRAGGTVGGATAAAREALASAGAVLVADYGRGVAGAVRPWLAEAARRVPLVWDPHPRGAAPVPGARLVTPNAAEAAGFTGAAGGEGPGLAEPARQAETLLRRWQAGSVALTLGARGALLTRGAGGPPMLLPAPYRATGDTCGAGDCFAAVAAAALADGLLPEEAVQRAVAAAAGFVAGGGAGGPVPGEGVPELAADRTAADPYLLAAAVRARGGTVVATGGCFDLLHAGHVALLEQARGLGDCLVVCLNGDDSVRRLKGPGRPLNAAADRARVLAGLGSVDAVAVFDEDTPEAVLRRLRPHLWVKGGDYTELPEAETLETWGGQALVLPYLAGRSTTATARRAAQAGER